MVTFRLLRRDVKPRRVAQGPFVTRRSRYEDASAPAALVGGATRSNFCVRALRPEIARGAIVVRHAEGNGIVLRRSLTTLHPFRALDNEKRKNWAFSRENESSIERMYANIFGSSSFVQSIYLVLTAKF